MHYWQSFAVINFGYLFCSPYSGLICAMNARNLLWVTVLTDEPYFIIDWLAECWEMVLLGANLIEAIRSQTISILVPTSKKSIDDFHFFFQFKFGKELTKLLDYFLFGKFTHLFRPLSWNKETKYILLLGYNGTRSTEWTSLLCMKIDPFLLGIPKGFFKANKQFICNSISNLFDCFFMALGQLRLKLHYFFLENSKRQTGNQFLALINLSVFCR